MALMRKIVKFCSKQVNKFEHESIFLFYFCNSSDVKIIYYTTNKYWQTFVNYKYNTALRVNQCSCNDDSKKKLKLNLNETKIQD